MPQVCLFSLVDISNWEAKLIKCFGKDKVPIQLNPHFIKLYADCDEDALFFTYEESNNYFYFPIIRKRIAPYANEYYDFESPYGYSGPLNNCNDDAFIFSAWQAFKQVCIENSIIAGFIRFNPLYENDNIPLPNYVNKWKESDIVILDLADQDAESIFKNYKSSVRNNIRKSEKNGITIQIDKTADLGDFIRIYHSTMQRVSAKRFYYFDDNYFNYLQKHLKNNYSVCYAYNEKGEKVGGILGFYSNNHSIIHLSSCLNDYLSLGVPSALRHAFIMESLAGKVKIINMGGGTSSDPNDSLLKFKKGFSKDTKDYYTASCLINEEKYIQVCNAWQSEHKDVKSPFFLKYRWEAA